MRLCVCLCFNLCVLVSPAAVPLPPVVEVDFVPGWLNSPFIVGSTANDDEDDG